MLIEEDARRHVLEAIREDQEMRQLEAQEKLKGRVVIRSPQYAILRRKLVDLCGRINAVANTQGKGRDDLKVEILLAAEDVSRKISNYRSKAVRKLSQEIKTSFHKLRCLFKKYSENIEAVDPQLKNNADLMAALLSYERAWSKGKNYLLDPKKRQTLLSMSELIEGLVEKHREVQEKIESVDAEIFITIPCLAILKAIDEKDSVLQYIYSYNNDEEHMKRFEEIKSEYKAIDSKGYELYNTLERIFLEKPMEEQLKKWADKEGTKKLVHDIKELAMMTQRTRPSEWNSLVETSMGIICEVRIVNKQCVIKCTSCTFICFECALY
eukprot:TRINITY_DN5466_c0_g1_i1.p1 TRINITY_DN5466_c0_g1~~TRINITY_DN5466_c0_g1_i1.p1  ORF type:complete len:325 (+),score=82.94 TRINITY_DN5466_c0_g1_i1:1118-2092(+)